MPCLIWPTTAEKHQTAAVEYDNKDTVKLNLLYLQSAENECDTRIETRGPV